MQNLRPTVAVAVLAFLVMTMIAPAAFGQGIYNYTGEPFAYADPPYLLGESITGSIHLAAPLPRSMPLTDISALMLDFTFADGVRTWVPGNTTICYFEVETDGAGNITDWLVLLRESPFPGTGNDVQSMDLLGPSASFPNDFVGLGTAGVMPCDLIAVFTYAASGLAGSWLTVRQPVTSIPTVSTMGAMLLAVLLAGMALLLLRGARAT